MTFIFDNLEFRQSRSRVLGEFQRLRPEIKKYLLSRLASEPDAEDMLQEFSLRLLSMDKSRLNLITECRAFFYRSINNMCIDLHRKNALRGSYVDEIDTLPEAVTTLSSERVVQDRQILDHLFILIGKLPPTCRQVFLLYRVKNLSQKEIAKELDISVNMVEKHIIKAHTTLRELMLKEGLI